MRILVTGSTGHLGETLMRLLPGAGHDPVGLDLVPGPFTRHVGSVSDANLVRHAMEGAEAVLHTATLHKPHVATHAKQAFVETNITGTLVLLEAALATGTTRFVLTSTTSAFGAALRPGPHAPAAWIDEDVVPVPRNIYGASKAAAEDLCALFARNHGMACVVLRTSRFFPEVDDSPDVRRNFDDVNAKANEFLYRRVDLEDAALAHLRAIERAPGIGFGRFIISATSPFERQDLNALRQDPAAVVARYYSDFKGTYGKRGFQMFPDIGRVYVNARAREVLGWRPVYDFGRVLQALEAGAPIGSDLSRAVGAKGYHAETFQDGPYPVAPEG